MALVFLVELAYTIVAMIWVTVLGKIWDTVKEKFWDTVLGKLCDTILGKIGDYVVAPLWQQFSPTPTCTKAIPNNKNFTAFMSRDLNMEDIIKALADPKINLIGICGLPGVGKTTMAKEVAKRAKEDGLFTEVASASVGQKPNIANVQACIADMLGLNELGDRASPEVRADLLRERLLQDDKKILVILDDIWEEIDLEDMGIPLGSTDKNFKMLYTSRTRHLWHSQQTKREIPLEVLSNEEAWQLFREKAGDSADARDLQPIAKQIVNECGRLPLALVLIGSALSKKSRRNAIEIWKGMLDRLTCATSTPADERLYSRLELSYEYLEDDEAKRLFLICCLFKEDEDIRVEDLARYGFGLSLFDGINEMGKLRSRVFLIVDDLKSRYLLLDSEEECVKVHDVVRDMGIYIASKDKYALVSHGASSDWPKKDTYEHYAAISVISRTVKELPEGLACPNLQLLMLECGELKKPPCNSFEGMCKLKVLVLNCFRGILKIQYLTNLRTLSLEDYRGDVLNNVSGFGALFNLEILSFRNSSIEELPEELGELANLKLLDLQLTWSLKRIPPGVIARLVHLEELYVSSSKFRDWEGEGKEVEGRNANLKEFESLSNLNTLEIEIRAHVLLPKVPIFSKLKIYKVSIINPGNVMQVDYGDYIYNLAKQCKRRLIVFASIPIPLDRGGIDSLLMNSDWLFVRREGCNNLVQGLLRNGADVLQQLKFLTIESCDTPESLVNTMNLATATAPATPVFPILQALALHSLANLREICRGPVPALSFGELNLIGVRYCGRLGSLFQLPIVGCLTQLKYLIIVSCGMMEEVFIWKEQRGDVHVASNSRIEFPKLKDLILDKLRSLIGFCRGIDQIDFPQLERLHLRDLGQLNGIFHSNSNMSSNSERDDHVGFHYLFPQQVSIPNLKVLKLDKLENLERLGDDPLPVGLLSQLKEFSVRDCGKLLCIFPSQLLSMVRDIEYLNVECCNLLEVVFELDVVDYSDPNQGMMQRGDVHVSTNSRIEFPKLKMLTLDKLQSLLGFCRGVDQIDFPELETLDLRDLGQLSRLFHNNSNGSSNSEQNDDVGFHYLFPQKVSLPNLKVLRLTELQNLERLGDDPLLVGSLSQLKKISVRDCGKLLCVIPSQLLSMLRDLVNLSVKCCNLLEVVFEFEGVDYNEPNPEILPPLELVKLSNLPKLNYISKRDPMGFKFIQALNIDKCNRLRYVFSPTMMKSIPQLRELKISRCEMLSKIIAEENELGESTVDEIEFPQLETVKLHNLPSLVSFFPNANTTNMAELTDRDHNPLQPRPLFTKKVAIPRLEYLELSGLGNVSDLWSSELPSGSFSKLKKLKVRYCASLRNMFHPSMAGSLLNLENLFISDCLTLEAVVGKEEQIGGHGREIHKTLFPELGKLQLSSLPNLRRFCHFTHPLKIPLLREVDIFDCPNMDAFSLKPVSAPNLSLPNTSWKGDLNNAILHLQERENRRKEWENHRKEEEKEKEKEKEKEDGDGDKEEKENVDEDDEEEDQEEKMKKEEARRRRRRKGKAKGTENGEGLIWRKGRIKRNFQKKEKTIEELLTAMTRQ